MAVFSPVRGTAAHAQLGPHPIEMSNADQEAEPFLQGGLDHMTWGMRSFTTRGLEKLPHWWTEFGRMSMPSILQGGFSSQMHIAQQLVSR